MKKIALTILICLFTSPLYAVNFGDTVFDITYDKPYLTIKGTTITLRVDDRDRCVEKLIPETWKSISAGSTGGMLLFATGSNTLTLENTMTVLSVYSAPKKKMDKKTEQVGPYTVTYDPNDKLLTAMAGEFGLRVYNCGMVEVLTWKEINKNTEQ